MKTNLIILLIGIAFVGCGQLTAQTMDRDSIESLIFDEFVKTYPHKNQDKWCDNFMKIAKRMCANDSIIIPNYRNDFWRKHSPDLSSTTCHEILKREYGFTKLPILPNQ